MRRFGHPQGTPPGRTAAKARARYRRHGPRTGRIEGFGALRRRGAAGTAAPSGDAPSSSATVAGSCGPNASTRPASARYWPPPNCTGPPNSPTSSSGRRTASRSSLFDSQVETERRGDGLPIRHVNLGDESLTVKPHFFDHPVDHVSGMMLLEPPDRKRRETPGELGSLATADDTFRSRGTTCRSRVILPDWVRTGSRIAGVGVRDRRPASAPDRHGPPPFGRGPCRRSID